MPDPSLYRRVAVRTWGLKVFRSLSAAPPNAQTLFLWLKTSPLTTVIPGVVVGGLASIAEGLRWKVPPTEKCWAELERADLATADWEAGLVWLPGELDDNPPASSAAVESWRKAYPELPECVLRFTIGEEITAFIAPYGDAFHQAWHGTGPSGHLDARLKHVLRETPALRQAIKLRDGDCCRYCDRPVNWKDRRGPLAGSYDHVDPAGPTTFANLVTACRGCRGVKGGQTVAAAGLTLQAARNPGLDPGPDLGGDLGPPAAPPGSSAGLIQTQEQEQEQKQEVPETPQPPSTGEGGRLGRPDRITRAERKLAEAIRAAHSGCPHRPQRCQSPGECIGALVAHHRRELAFGLAG